MSKCENCIHYDVCLDVEKNIKALFSISIKHTGCEYFKDKSLFVELPCEWGKDVYTIVKSSKHILKTKLFAIGITEEGYITYNPSEYPKDVFGINGVILGENTFANKESAEQKLKEMEK